MEQRIWTGIAIIAWITLVGVISRWSERQDKNDEKWYS